VEKALAAVMDDLVNILSVNFEPIFLPLEPLKRSYDFIHGPFDVVETGRPESGFVLLFNGLDNF
jgi:hypothetical protein